MILPKEVVGKAGEEAKTVDREAKRSSPTLSRGLIGQHMISFLLVGLLTKVT